MEVVIFTFALPICWLGIVTALLAAAPGRRLDGRRRDLGERCVWCGTLRARGKMVDRRCVLVVRTVAARALATHATLYHSGLSKHVIKSMGHK